MFLENKNNQRILNRMVDVNGNITLEDRLITILLRHNGEATLTQITRGVRIKKHLINQALWNLLESEAIMMQKDYFTKGRPKVAVVLLKFPDNWER